MLHKTTTIPYGHLLISALCLVMLIMLGVLVHDTRYIMNEDAQLMEMGKDMETLQKDFAQCERDTQTYGGVCWVESKEDGSFEVLWSAE